MGHRGHGGDDRGLLLLGPGAGGPGPGLLGSGGLSRGLGSWLGPEHWGLGLLLRLWGLLGLGAGPRLGPGTTKAGQRGQTELGQLGHAELEGPEAGELGHSGQPGLLTVSCLGPFVDRPAASLGGGLPLKLPQLGKLGQSSLLGLGESLCRASSLNRSRSRLSDGARLLLQDGCVQVMRLVELGWGRGLPESPADPERVRPGDGGGES